MTLTKRKQPQTAPDKKPCFERRDVVTLVGIFAPNMLVTNVSRECNEFGYYDVTVAYNTKDGLSDMYEAISEDLLRLVMPASAVDEVAAQETKNARLLAPHDGSTFTS